MYQIFFLYILFFSSGKVFTQQIEFEQKKKNNVHQFYYEFRDAKKEKHQVQFDLSDLKIQEANHLIPKLSVLRKKFQEEIPRFAEELGREVFFQINNKFREHTLGLHRFVKNQVWDYNFQIVLNCPNEFIIFNIGTSRRNIKFNQRIRTQGCELKTVTKNSFKQLILKLEKEINVVQKNLPQGSVYRLIPNRNYSSYRIQIQLKAKTQVELHQVEYDVQQAQKRIEAIKKSYDAEQKKLKESFNILIENHRSFLEQFKPKIKQAFEGIYQEISKRNESFYQQHYLFTEKKGNQLTVYPDYFRIAQYYQNELIPISTQFQRYPTERETAEVIMNFLQSIPYSRLEERDIEGLSGFLTPVAMFQKNRGDCDSKSVAYLALLNSVLPNTKKVFVLIQNHAFVALHVPARKDDVTIDYQGEKYVVAEVAGPALFYLGQAGKNSLRAIQNNKIQRIIPF